MGKAAARAGNNIHHTSALAGFIVGSLIDAALIASVAFATFTCGFGAALVAGLVAGAAAGGIRSLGEWVGSKCKSTTGKILPAGCSTNVLINNRPAARAVLSNAECEKDIPMAPVAEGSSNVFINQYAAARKDDKIQCGATISEGSDDVIIGGGKVQYLTIKDEGPAWVKKASDILFTVAGIAGGAAGAFKQVGGVLNKCALKFVGGYVAGEIAGNYITDKAMGFIGGLFGNPVDVIDGQKVLFDEQELDFVVSARLPLYWQRYYSSALDEGILGQGWRLDFEITLSHNDTEIVYCGRTGQQTLFPALLAGEYSYSESSQLYLYCMTDGRHVIRTLTDIYTVFPPFDDVAGKIYPEHIEDPDRNYILFHYDEKQPARLCGISDSQNNVLVCHWHPTLRRLIAVEQVYEQAQKELRVRYRYDEHGNLVAVENVAGKQTRQYGYDDNGLMVSHRNALGFQCFYQWQKSDADGWRVIESHNNEDERAHFLYDTDHGCTTVTDERGLQARWYYNVRGQVIRFEEFSGEIYGIDYNDSDMPVKFTLPGERTIEIERDGLNRIIAETDPLGRTVHTDYWQNTLHVVRKQFADDSVWQCEYDGRGHPLWVQTGAGCKTHYAWDDNGQLRQITDPAGGKKTLTWNVRGQLVRRTDCSGKQEEYTWNRQGDLLSLTTATGNTTQFVYNEQHELTSVQHPDGAQEQFSYFSGGLLRRHTDTAGRSREWRYNRRGQPLQYQDALSRHLHCYYDVKGNLIRLLNANGGEYRFGYDTAGRLTEECRPDGTQRRLTYDAAGLPERQCWSGSEHSAASPQQRDITYVYDKASRLISRHTGMSDYRYSYDTGDRLTALMRHPTASGTEAGTGESELAFEYDADGLLTAERSDGEMLSYAHDRSGNLTALTLPDGNRLSWLH